MRLDFDCIRDILLCVEEHTGIHTLCYFFDVQLKMDVAEFLGDCVELQPYHQALLETYGNDKLYYHVLYCVKDGLLETPENGMRASEVYISDLSPDGHKLLGDIRDPERWIKTKKAATALRAYSLDAVSKIASGVAEALINTYFKNNGAALFS